MKLLLKARFFRVDDCLLVGLVMGERMGGFNVGLLCDQVGEISQNRDRLDGISCTTFNILAPIFKRMDGGRRESERQELWQSRNEGILDTLLHLKSSIICLQEFWIGNRELVGMYERQLGEAGYIIYKLARTNNRGDGLLTAVHQSQFRVINYRELLFNDIADRVAQILHVELHSYLPKNTSNSVLKEVLIVNTHLIFPHDSRYCFLRLQQVYKLLQYVKSYFDKHALPPIPIILCGDWNGSKKGHVYKFLKSQGFVSTYDTVHHSTDEGEGPQKWVSHRNHRGNICGVDFIWLRNPQKFQKPLKESFVEAVLGNLKKLLQKSVTDNYGMPPQILSLKSSCLTHSQFSHFLNELGISSQALGGLSVEVVKDLWDRIDSDGDGVADVRQLLRACTDREGANKRNLVNQRGGEESDEFVSGVTLGFKVKGAKLFPSEVEKGMWPENYSLSDHAQLTVDFSTIEMHFSSTSPPMEPASRNVNSCPLCIKDTNKYLSVLKGKF